MAARRVAILLAIVLGVTACSTEADTRPHPSPITVGEKSFLDEDDVGVIAAASKNRDLPIDEIIAELEANEFCLPSDVEDGGDIGTVTAMHFVVDGKLREPCAGTLDDRLIDAWDKLVAIARHEDVADISLLAGYEACEGCATLAFVTSLDEAGTFFLMAIDVTAAQADPDELLLTLVHELSHVITQNPRTELNIGVGPDQCDTYYNGSGCFTRNSYAWRWIEEFWSPEDLARVANDPDLAEGAEDRCTNSAPYTGYYGATNPEEDFAEAFSAYVFSIELPSVMDAKLAFFDRYPEFVKMREQVSKLGLTGLSHSFEGCG
ncbi:MAG: hypothetical protein CSA55_02995 [Ilumatobacter coccineus]|uniref:Lipoprotein n=1 Tax=Ilumatobacter coccineus TaxID=467094 RepID=A0A2G6KCP4_9ACTN|nr:MAG: hypothetical protein CSA55_02995 [Ilumatobacter coccineus]